MDTQALRIALDQTLADRYRIEHELGIGGMARVYSARDVRHQRQVAIKILKPEIAALHGPERFLREINLTAGLQHPHILPLLDSGTVVVGDLSMPYYVMPLTAGQSVRTRLDLEGRLPLAEVIAIGIDAGQALAFAHERGIVHRDIKPENLLISEAGPVLVADFGIARALSFPEQPSITEEGTSVGTPLYMSPEQAFGEGEVDHRSDQYSLATVLFELLTGRAPHEAPTKEAILARRLVEPPPSLASARPELAAALDPVLQRALARKPDDRYPSIREFVHAFEVAGRGGSSPAPERGRARWSGRLSVGAVLLAVLGGGYLWQRQMVPVKPKAKPIVAVLTFENLTRDTPLDALGPITADWIVRGIAEAGFARIVSPEITIQGEARDRSARASDSAGRARRVGRVVGANTAVVGYYRAVGDSLEFMVQLIDVRSNEITRGIRPIRTSRTDLGEAASTVRQRVVGALAVMIEGPKRDPIIAKSGATPKYEAYRAYTEAVQLDKSNRILDAIKAAERAYRLDSSFVMPLFVLINEYTSLGRTTEADSVLALIGARQATLSPVEAATVRAQAGVLHGDLASALAAQREVDSLAPSDDNKYGIALVEAAANRFRAALATIEQCNVENGLLIDDETFWNFSVGIRHRLARYEEGLALARLGRRHLPGSLSIRQMEIIQLVALGRMGEVDSGLAAVRQVATPEPGAAVLTLANIAGELRTHGHADRGKRAAEEGLAWLASLGPSRSGVLPRVEVVLLMELGRWREALSLADSLRKAEPGDLYYAGSAAVSLVRLGQIARADSITVDLIRDQSHGNPGEREFTMARVSAAKGDAEQTVRWLQRALASGFNAVSVILHVEPQFDQFRERHDFQAVTQPQG
jgi:serine/threonine-protein kinase